MVGVYFGDVAIKMLLDGISVVQGITYTYCVASMKKHHQKIYRKQKKTAALRPALCVVPIYSAVKAQRKMAVTKVPMAPISRRERRPNLST